MSERDPETDWSDPRPDFSRGAGPGTAGANPQYEHMTPLAASSWQRNRRVFVSIAVSIALFALGLVVFVVVGNS